MKSIVAGTNISIDSSTDDITINSTGGGVSDAYTQAETNTLLSNKQDTVAGVTNTEIGYLSNVTSDLQTQLDERARMLGGSITNARVMVGASSNRLKSSSITEAQLEQLDGVLNPIQPELDARYYKNEV